MWKFIEIEAFIDDENKYKFQFAEMIMRYERFSKKE